MSFVARFMDQDGWRIIQVLGIVAGVYLTPVGLAMYTFRRRLGFDIRHALLTSVAGIGIFSVAVTLVLGVAFHNRFVPPGTGFQRQNDDYDEFALTARVALFGGYLLSIGLVTLVARWNRSRREAIVSVIVLLGYFLVSFVFVNHFAQCFIGQGIGGPESCN